MPEFIPTPVTVGPVFCSYRRSQSRPRCLRERRGIDSTLQYRNQANGEQPPLSG
jgi:hypothetical protein